MLQNTEGSREHLGMLTRAQKVSNLAGRRELQ